MAEYQEFQLPKRYHEALVGWQQRNFPDLQLLQKHWKTHFSTEPEFSLSVKVASLKNNDIEVGMYKGRPKVMHAGDMKGNMLYSALRIIKAQCSTELGSIQQHLCTLDHCTSDIAKFSILRIMAEELRHAYQMFWVLSNDASWSKAGVRDLADQTMDELLAMETGTHILDAFNIPFIDTLDNIVFAFLIDRVGKYQLSMQKVFAYAPMAQSMQPMLQEESFHLLAGNDLLKDIVIMAAREKGLWSLEEIQRRIYAWVPRALEMFGNSEGGQTNIDFGFKDKLNGDSANAYLSEVARLIRRMNLAVLMEWQPSATREKLESILDNDEDERLLRLPNVRFFRMRGGAGVAHCACDVNGNDIGINAYRAHLQDTLPAQLLDTNFFKKYWDAVEAAHSAN